MNIFTKQSLLLLCSMCFFYCVRAQNLVPNPSFENGSCVVNYNSTPQKIPTTINDWYSCTGASPDPFDTCGTALPAAYDVFVPDILFGYQYAHTGARFMGFGFYGGWFEYIGCKLKEPLQAGETYSVSFWLSCADNMLWAADQIGVYFSTTDIGYPTSNGYGTKLNYTPQAVNATGNFITDTTWARVNTSFVAAGGEQYIVIGYFKDITTATINNFYLFPDPGNGLKRKANPYYQPTVAGTGTTSGPRCYYYIDDVSVLKVAQGALPVSLTNFSARRVNNSVELSWQTASEINNCRFEIEQSTDGRNFTVIGTTPGAGTSSVVKQYSFTQSNPADGKLYYRLKQVDCDGKYSYSKVITINSGTNSINIYPNLVQNSVTVERASAVSATALIYDLNGRLLQSQRINSARETINVSNLLQGAYLLKVESDKGVATGKFIKQ